MKLIEEIFRLILLVIKCVFSLIAILFNPNLIWSNAGGKYQARKLSWWARFKLINVFNKGVCVNGYQQTTIHDAKSHVICEGRSGIGKTSVVSVCSLLKWNGSSVTVDMNSDLWTLCSTDLRKRGITPVKMDLIKLLESVFWNPFTRCTSNSACKALAQTLVKTSLLKSDKQDSFWNLMAQNILYTGIRILKKQKPQFQNLVNLRNLVLNWNHLHEIVAGCEDDDIVNEYGAILDMDERVRSSAIATALAALEPFTDEGIGFITSKTTFDFSLLTKRKTALFIVMSEAKLPIYAPLLSIFFQQLFEFFQLNKPKKPVMCLMDEAGQYYVPNLPMLATTLRRYNVILVLLLQQAQAQLSKLYGVSGYHEIWNGSMATKIIFSFSYELAQKMSHAFGKRSLIMDSPNEDKRKYVSDRELATIDELLNMKTGTAVYLYRNKPVHFMKTRGYYAQRSLRKRTRLAPVRVPPNKWYKVPILPIPKHDLL